MLLDELIRVIETIENRIERHGNSLRENETRTRMALIDPLLSALGWDTATRPWSPRSTASAAVVPTTPCWTGKVSR